MSSRIAGLYAVTPDEADSDRLFALVEAALAGGTPWLQYRNKLAGPAQRAREARRLRELCAAAGARLIVNDEPRLAAEVDAAGVHLGRDDGGVAAARALVGRRLIGVSCYDQLLLAEAAVAAGADYIAFGSVFASPTKPAAVRAPLSLFAQSQHLGVPRVAIGGIRLDNATVLIEAGADALAVIADVFGAPQPDARARAYAALFADRKPTP